MDHDPTMVPPERRRHTRLEVFSIATSSIGDQGKKALMLDISQHGFRIQTEADIAKGSTLALTCVVADICHATVMWRRGSECGCQFERPLLPAEVSALLDDSLKITVLPRDEAQRRSHDAHLHR